MRKFNITVNGTPYEVEIEEIKCGEVLPSSPKTTASDSKIIVPAPKSVSAQPTPNASGSIGSVNINAPLPGVVMAVKVVAGQTVKRGDVLTVIEAMKMENEIKAPQDGVIASVNVAKGTSVTTGQLLVSIK